MVQLSTETRTLITTADNMLEMTDTVYVLTTNGGNHVKTRVFTSGNGMVSLEYAGKLR